MIEFGRGETIFAEGDPSNGFYTVARGRVKIVKMIPEGRNVILELFGPGDPLGAVAVYQEVPYPATAVAIEPATCLRIERAEFFRLLQTRPTLVRGLLTALTYRLVTLTNRLVDRSGKVETRFARLFLKLSDELGVATPKGTLVPLHLTRQELADLMGTTVETSIRIMSRWGKEGLVESRDEGFLVAGRRALQTLSLG